MNPTASAGARDESLRAADAVLPDLYSRHWTYLVKYVEHQLSDAHQAQDIVQETMLRAWRHADRLDFEQGSVRGWLCRVARNVMIDRIRHKRARPTEVDQASAPPEAHVARDHAADVVNAVDVQRALAQLQPIHRAVLQQVYFNGRTSAEAAVVLGIPVGTVHSRLHYALRRLRTIVGQNSAE